MLSAALARRSTLPLVAALALAGAAAAFAQAPSAARPKPPGTVPLEDVPPPPPMITTKPEPQPQITTRTQGEETVQEYRINNKLYMMRVTPKGGKPYVLMDLRGDGTFTRQDPSIESGLRVPQWVLLEF